MKLPSYVKFSLILIGLFTFFAILYIAKGVIVPIVFAIIVSIVLHPVVNFLVRLRINRVIAIIITLLLTFVIMAAFGLLVISQISRFADSWPIMVDRFTTILNQTISDASVSLEINPARIHEWINKTTADLINISGAAIGKSLVIAGSALVIIFLIPVYIFLILFYHPLLIDFIRKLFGTNNEANVNAIVTKTKTVIQHYLVGIMIELTIVAILETIALLILGIDYAILFGILGAMFNLIPYIGAPVAVAMPVMVSLVTKTNPWEVVYIIAIYWGIQLIDNNFIVPKIVASKVRLNALFTIMTVIVGNAIWGIPGMFLSIPLLAIVKVIFDHIEPLKPWGFLLGDTMPFKIKIKPILKIKI